MKDRVTTEVEGIEILIAEGLPKSLRSNQQSPEGELSRQREEIETDQIPLATPLAEVQSQCMSILANP